MLIGILSRLPLGSSHFIRQPGFGKFVFCLLLEKRITLSLTLALEDKFHSWDRTASLIFSCPVTLNSTHTYAGHLLPPFPYTFPFSIGPSCAVRCPVGWANGEGAWNCQRKVGEVRVMIPFSCPHKVTSDQLWPLTKRQLNTRTLPHSLCMGPVFSRCPSWPPGGYWGLLFHGSLFIVLPSISKVSYKCIL